VPFPPSLDDFAWTRPAPGLDCHNCQKYSSYCSNGAQWQDWIGPSHPLPCHHPHVSWLLVLLCQVPCCLACYQVCSSGSSLGTGWCYASSWGLGVAGLTPSLSRRNGCQTHGRCNLAFIQGVPYPSACLCWMCVAPVLGKPRPCKVPHHFVKAPDDSFL
jgi:hypothetical protein